MNSISLRCFSTALGWAGLAAAADTLKKIYLPEPRRELLLGRMAVEFPQARQADACLGGAVEDFCEYFSGGTPTFSSRLDFGGATEFQIQVWEAARLIAYGQIRTYGWLAAQIGCPAGSRAVGAALGKNPFPIIIPCHRVIRSDGGLGGFSAMGGMALKKKLLQLEGVAVRL